MSDQEEKLSIRSPYRAAEVDTMFVDVISCKVPEGRAESSKFISELGEKRGREQPSRNKGVRE